MLSDSAMEDIARKYLQELQQRSMNMGLQLQLPDELAELLKQGATAKDGARQIRRQVQELVEGPLAVFLLQSGRKLSKVRGWLDDGVLQFQS